MRLLDISYTKDKMRVELAMLDGNISRLCCSDDVEEILTSLGFAIDRLSMIAYSRVKALNAIKKAP